MAEGHAGAAGVAPRRRFLPLRVRSATVRYSDALFESAAEVCEGTDISICGTGHSCLAPAAAETPPLLPNPVVDSLELELPPGIDTITGLPVRKVSQRKVFGLLDDGSYAGFIDENHQMFRCGPETAYWAVVSELGRKGDDGKRKRSHQSGAFWTVVSIKSIRATGGTSSIVNPTVRVAFWSTASMEHFYGMGRAAGKVLAPEELQLAVWSRDDGWEAELASCAIRYQAWVSPYSPTLQLICEDHVALRAVNHVSSPGVPIKILSSHIVASDATGFTDLLRSVGTVLDPPALSCLQWGISGKACGKVSSTVALLRRLVPVCFLCPLFLRWL